MLGENIDKLRKIKGLTQKELAEKVGTYQSAINRYIRNEQMPRRKMIAKLAAALDTDVDTLCNGTIYDAEWRRSAVGFKCTVCGGKSYRRTKHCSHCGLLMKGARI